MKRFILSKSMLCLFLLGMVCNVALAQTVVGVLGNPTTTLTDGNYVLVAMSDKGTGPVIYDANAGEGKHYRYLAGTLLNVGDNVLSKYIWTIDETTVDGVQHITVTNYDDNTKKFPADGAKNQNFTGSNVASLKTEVKTIGGTNYIALTLDDSTIGYIHANKPSGNPCLSYWDGYGDSGSCIKFTFYPVKFFVQPETGKYYKLKGDNSSKPWLTNTLNGNSIVVSANESEAAIFQKTENGLVDIATGKYIGKKGNNVSLVDGEKQITIGEYNNGNGKYSVKVQDNYMYNNNTDGIVHESREWITNIERYWGFIETYPEVPAEADYVVNTTTGTFAGSGDYRTLWTYTTKVLTPASLTLSCNAANMNSHDELIQLHSGQSGTSTYTLTVTEGYSIVGYSFRYGFGNSGTGDKKFVIGEQEYPVSSEQQTINIDNINARTTSFVLSGSNEPVKMFEFVVKIKHPTPEEIAQYKEDAKTAVGENAGKLKDALGYYSYTVNGEKVYDGDDVKTAIDAAKTVDEILVIKNSFALNIPQVGKYYRIKGISGNYIDAVNCYSDDQMGMKTQDECNYLGTIFLLDEGNRLKNVCTDTYVYNTRHIGATKANANTWTFAASTRTLGCFTLQSSYSTASLLHDNEGNRADRCKNLCNNPGRHDFTIEEVKALSLTISAPSKVKASATWNGETKALPATWNTFEGVTATEPTISISNNEGYQFEGWFENEESLGNTVSISSLEHNRTITANFTPAFFSTTYGEKWVRLQNCSGTNYWATMENVAASSNGKTATIDYADTKQLWCLVGTAEGFVLYNKAGGENLALKVTATTYANGSQATLENDTQAKWKLIEQDFGFAFVPTHNTNASDLGINMYGGNGGDLKLFGTATTNTGSYWVVEVANSNPTNLNVKVDKVWESSPRVAELTFTVNGKASQMRILGKVEDQALYLPAGATYEVSSMTYRGYTYNGCKDNDGVLTVSYTANDERTLFYTPKDGHPYRIPAVATAPNGDIFAICDYRPCNKDIGYGEVDIVCRISSDNGATWGEELVLADGDGGNTNRMETGYGDPAIVADRESNKILVMMVCGRTVCHNGRWDKSKIGVKDATAVNRVARIYGTYDETTESWKWTQPEEVTDHIYSLFLNGETPTVTSMFIGSGKVCQSRVVKKGDYYRLYCSMWTRDGGNRVIYSDDFGGSWNVLGTINDRPASGGDEPKVEELADGTVVLSSRKGGGRYFNIFTFADNTYTTGTWGTVASSNDVSGGLSFGGNSTNGEIYKVKAIRKSDGQICDIMLQSVPTGSGRTDVAIYYKEMEYNEDGTNKYTPETFSTGWTKGKHVSTKSSCYSTMIMQKDGRLAFFFEEAPGEFCMVYIPYTIEDVTGGAYSLYTVNSSIGQYEIGTFYASEAMQIPEGVKAYVAKKEPTLDNNVGVLQMEELDGIIPANTGAVITGAANTYSFIPSISYGATVSTNMLYGYEANNTNPDLYSSVAVEGNSSFYILSVKNEVAGFYKKSTNFKVYNNKAYLNIPGQYQTIRLRFNNNDGTTGIIEVPTEALNMNGAIYDLSGRRVEKATKGVYIVNGKKVIF